MKKMIMNLDRKSLLEFADNIKDLEDDVVRLELFLPPNTPEFTKTDLKAFKKTGICEIVEGE